MPQAATHAYFAKDVYKKLPAKVKKKTDLDLMITFSQGPDAFYNAVTLHGNKNNYHFGYMVHTTKTKKFLIEYTDHILKYRLEKNLDVVSSLYGMMLHNVLDKKTHPLIYYQTSKDSLKHREMELLIDLYMIEKRERKDPKSINLTNFIFPKMTDSKPLINLLDRVYEDVYNVPNMGKTYIKGLKGMRFSYTHLRYDPYGHKRNFYQVLTNLPFVSPRINTYSYANNLRDKIWYINYEHEKWTHPCNKNEVSTKSFFDLYNEAIDIAVEMITKTHEVLSHELDLKELDSVIDNKSMLTGKDCNLSGRMRYFRDK